MNSRRRLLVLSSTVPFPPHGGGRMRIYQVLRRLGREHDVHLIALGSPVTAAQREALRDVCREVTLLPAPPPRVGLARWVRAFRNQVTFRAFDEHPAIRRAIVELATGHDLVLVENVYMLPYAIALGDVPKVVDIFGLWTGGLGRDLVLTTGWLDRLRVLLSWAKAKRVERSLRWMADAVCVVSESDRRYLSAIDPRLEIYTAPNGVDTAYFRPRPETPPPPVHLVFSGAMDYGPNEHAAFHFLGEIFPAIRARLPGARFLVVGRDPSERVLGLARDPAVIVTGEMPDVRPLLARATVVVVPMRLGSGTRIKVLEALAMARPVVSTSVGVEGLPLVAGTHLEIADDPVRFAEAVVRLAGDADARRRLGQQGRELVEARYAWDTVLASLSDVIRHLAGGRGARACPR
jgi:polysaccharide biosynthesis protein PslH